MKKALFIILTLALVLSLAACAPAAEPETDYGSSSLYSREDMDAAIALIRAEFSTWQGCELHSVRYAGDEANNPENLAWLNSLEPGKSYTQCIEFLSDFHSPKKQSGAWNPDEEYYDWQWWLAREAGGSWELLTWGY